VCAISCSLIIIQILSMWRGGGATAYVVFLFVCLFPPYVEDTVPCKVCNGGKGLCVK